MITVRFKVRDYDVEVKHDDASIVEQLSKNIIQKLDPPKSTPLTAKVAAVINTDLQLAAQQIGRDIVQDLVDGPHVDTMHVSELDRQRLTDAWAKIALRHLNDLTF